MATTKKTTKVKAVKAEKAEKVVKTVRKTVKKVKAPESNVFAVIATGGKQYVVKEGEFLNVELLKDTKEGDNYTFDDVLLIASGDDVKIGTPYVAGAKVKAEIQKEVRGDKVMIMKYKRKTRARTKKGHRQTYSRVKIVEIK